MKYTYVLVAALAALSLAGCNQPNNGEVPPANELPLPYPRHNAKSTGSATPPPMTSTASASAATGTTAASTGKKSAKSVASGPYKFDAAKGKAAYSDTCSVCHQDSGKGIPGTFPPLKGNPVVTNADPTEQILTVLHGAHGAKTILGVKYNGVMPPFGSNLNDVEIANLINYERSSWGNHAKHATPEEVAKVRAGGKAG